MFGPSLKSVPGCLVSIVPMLIGVPVAFTPGCVPQVEVLAAPPLLLLALALVLLLALALVALPPVLELLLLLPHPASTTTAMTAASTKLSRTRGAS
jgi:hypothetical protein